MPSYRRVSIGLVTRPVLLAVDGNSLVHRSFHALAATGMRSGDGEPIWAVRGLLTQLVAAVERIGPVAVVVGFDDASTSVRRQKWPQYKANRTDKLASLVQQLELAIIVLTELGVHVVVPDGLEADDVLASAASFAAANDARTVIMTSDRDSFAIIDDNTSVLRIINGGVDASPVLTPERLTTMLGIHPRQYRDFAALRGDPSDNLPGVRGIGPKTAAKLLAALGSARAAFDDLAEGGHAVRAAIGDRAAGTLAAAGALRNWQHNCEVMAFHADLDLELTLSGGPGVLPLPVEIVRSVFAGQQLPATLPTALRVLAHHEQDGPEPVFADPVRASDWPPNRPYWSGTRYGKLPAKPAARDEQLALF
ncbi:MAG: 5-3 exonuclease [Pseudonocardiales bacterium]|nr:5-3 exonuclease [Pseudonocardiales bacterium]